MAFIEETGMSCLLIKRENASKLICRPVRTMACFPARKQDPSQRQLKMCSQAPGELNDASVELSALPLKRAGAFSG